MLSFLGMFETSGYCCFKLIFKQYVMRRFSSLIINFTHVIETCRHGMNTVIAQKSKYSRARWQNIDPAALYLCLIYLSRSFCYQQNFCIYAMFFSVKKWVISFDFADFISFDLLRLRDISLLLLRISAICYYLQVYDFINIIH